MITIKFKNPEVMARFQDIGPRLITSLSEKLHGLMIQLQSKIIGETLPEYFPDGAPIIASTVREIPPSVDGNKISAFVDAGGPTTTKRTLGGPNAGATPD